MRGLLGLATLILLWIIFYYLDLFNLPKPIFYQYLTLGLITVVQPIGIYFMIWRNYHSSNHLREPLEIVLTEKEIKIKGDSFYMEILWDKLFKITEEQNWFLIYQNNLSAVIIPKKSFSSKEINNFKKILSTITAIPVTLKS